MQNERAAVLFRSHSSERNLADGSFPIGRPNNVNWKGQKTPAQQPSYEDLTITEIHHFRKPEEEL